MVYYVYITGEGAGNTGPGPQTGPGGHTGPGPEQAGRRCRKRGIRAASGRYGPEVGDMGRKQAAWRPAKREGGAERGGRGKEAGATGAGATNILRHCTYIS